MANTKSMPEIKVKSITSSCVLETFFPLFKFTLGTPKRLSTTAHGGPHNAYFTDNGSSTWKYFLRDCESLLWNHIQVFI